MIDTAQPKKRLDIRQSIDGNEATKMAELAAKMQEMTAIMQAKDLITKMMEKALELDIIQDGAAKNLIGQLNKQDTAQGLLEVANKAAENFVETAQRKHNDDKLEFKISDEQLAEFTATTSELKTALDEIKPTKSSWLDEAKKRINEPQGKAEETAQIGASEADKPELSSVSETLPETAKPEAASTAQQSEKQQETKAKDAHAEVNKQQSEESKAQNNAKAENATQPTEATKEAQSESSEQKPETEKTSLLEKIPGVKASRQVAQSREDQALKGQGQEAQQQTAGKEAQTEIPAESGVQAKNNSQGLATEQEQRAV